jgi:hypothetical protein
MGKNGFSGGTRIHEGTERGALHLAHVPEMATCGKTSDTALAALVATGAVAATMRLLRRLGATDLHFPRAIGTLVGPQKPSTRVLGWAAFVSNGVALGVGYRLLLGLAPRSRRPLLGASVGLAHGLVTAAGAHLLSPLHPRPRRAGLRRRGRTRGRDLAALSVVHVVYGALLGTLFAR